MSGSLKLSNKTRLFILDISALYGGLLSFIFIFIFLLLPAFFPGTIKYYLIQAILLPFGIILTAIFAKLNIRYDQTSGDAVFPIFPGLIISMLCLAPAYIIVRSLISVIFHESLFNPMIMFFLIIGSTGLVLGTLSLYAVLNSKRTSPAGIKRWKVRGLQISTAMLVAGLVIAGISTNAGPITNSVMEYEVWLDTSENTTFLIPIPVNSSNENIGDSITGLTVTEGEADWKIVDTEHGKAFEVHTRDKCTLYAKKNYGSMSWDEADKWLESFTLSTLKGVNRGGIYEIWVYSSTNSSINIRLSLDDGWNNSLLYKTVGYTHDNIFTYEIPLEEGWQIIRLDKNMAFYD